MIVTAELPIAYPITTTITEPNKSSTVTCALVTPSGTAPNASLTYTVTMSTGGTVTKSVSGSTMTLSFTSPTTSSKARGATYTITITASNGTYSKASTITLIQNNTLKTSKPTCYVVPLYYRPVHYYSVTAASTAAKVVAIGDITLTEGRILSVNFDSGSTVASPTLTLSDGTNSSAAKAIWSNGAALTSNYTLDATKIYTFIYSDGYWHLLDSVDYDENVDGSHELGGYGASLSSEGSNAFNYNSLKSVILFFTPFSTFYWYAAQGEYPPADF